jgi:uncharacterized membrane protein required for colicin V production
MNWIDLVILALLAFGLIQGFIDGLIIEIAELAALVLGIGVAIRFSWWTAEKLAGWFDIQRPGPASYLRGHLHSNSHCGIPVWAKYLTPF